MAASSYFRRELRPPAGSFYRRELGELSRPDRCSWAKPKAGCPFHRSKSKTSFVVNLESGGFYCFSCGAKGGDVLAFMMLRYGYTFKTAAQLLGCWREDLSRAERIQLDERIATIRFEKEQAEQVERQHRLRLRNEIHTTARIYSETNDRLSVLRQEAAPAEKQIEPCWAVLSLGLDDLRSCEQEYMEIIGLEYTG
jgi:CHC2 zinc finger